MFPLSTSGGENPFILAILIQTIASDKVRRINRQVRKERRGMYGYAASIRSVRRRRIGARALCSVRSHPEDPFILPILIQTAAERGGITAKAAKSAKECHPFMKRCKDVFWFLI